jgi:hypothetical protein
MPDEYTAHFIGKNGSAVNLFRQRYAAHGIGIHLDEDESGKVPKERAVVRITGYAPQQVHDAKSAIPAHLCATITKRFGSCDWSAFPERAYMPVIRLRDEPTKWDDPVDMGDDTTARPLHRRGVGNPTFADQGRVHCYSPLRDRAWKSEKHSRGAGLGTWEGMFAQPCSGPALQRRCVGEGGDVGGLSFFQVGLRRVARSGPDD